MMHNFDQFYLQFLSVNKIQHNQCENCAFPVKLMHDFRILCSISRGPDTIPVYRFSDQMENLSSEFPPDERCIAAMMVTPKYSTYVAKGSLVTPTRHHVTFE